MPDPIERLDEKIEKLKDHFQRQTGCTVHRELKSEFRCHRFYFEKGDQWKFIVDVCQDDLEKQDVPKIITQLDAGKWQSVLEKYSETRIPFFKDKKFANPAEFREWPTTFKHSV